MISPTSPSTTPPSTSDDVLHTYHLPSAVVEEVVGLRAENAQLRDTVARLMARVEELERQLGLNSSNSGKPPSSDGLKKPSRTLSLRERSGKSSGGQPGHAGETLCQVAEPQGVMEHYPTHCRGCGGSLRPDPATPYSARQVFDLPEPQPLVVTEHRAHTLCCGGCGDVTRAVFPEGVGAPVQYGARLSAVAVYLQQYQLIPEDRLKELMSDLFGVELAAATLARMSARCAKRFQGVVEHITGYVKTAAVKQLDETGCRIGGATRWLHVAATLWLTFYRVSPKRGSLLDGLRGIVIHDHWKPYYTLEGVEHALCNAHHLRELQALIQIEGEAWAAHMQRLLRRACHVANLARQRDAPLPPRLVERFQRRYDEIVAKGLAFHEVRPPLPTPAGRRRGRPRRRIGHNLLLRLGAHRGDVLRFLNNPRVPFTNNVAEQALRMMKVRQKISGGFRCEQGAREFAVLRSLIATAKKQGWNVIQTLTRSPDHFLDKLRIT
jgi:transposase